MWDGTVAQIKSLGRSRSQRQGVTLCSGHKISHGNGSLSGPTRAQPQPHYPQTFHLALASTPMPGPRKGQPAESPCRIAPGTPAQVCDPGPPIARVTEASAPAVTTINAPNKACRVGSPFKPEYSLPTVSVHSRQLTRRSCAQDSSPVSPSDGLRIVLLQEQNV